MSQADDSLRHSSLRDEVGYEDVPPPPALQQDRVASYKIVSHHGRDIPKDYRGVVFSSWLKSLRYLNDYFKLIDKKAYYSAYSNYIEGVLARPQTTARYAVLSDDPDVVLGWAITEPGILHYVHVQVHQRKQGIARALVPESTRVITHLTKIGLSIWGSKMPRVIFDPFS